MRIAICGKINWLTHHNSVLFLARVLGFVHVVITVTLVILRYRATLELAKPREWSGLDQHLLEADRLVLRTVKHIRSIFVEDDALAHYVAALHRDEKCLNIWINISKNPFYKILISHVIDRICFWCLIWKIMTFKSVINLRNIAANSAEHYIY